MAKNESASLIAERAGAGWTIRTTGMEIVRPRDGDNASATSTLIEGTLRVQPGGGAMDDEGDAARGAVIRAWITHRGPQR